MSGVEGARGDQRLAEVVAREDSGLTRPRGEQRRRHAPRGVWLRSRTPIVRHFVAEPDKKVGAPILEPAQMRLFEAAAPLAVSTMRYDIGDWKKNIVENMPTGRVYRRAADCGRLPRRPPRVVRRPAETRADALRLAGLRRRERSAADDLAPACRAPLEHNS